MNLFNEVIILKKFLFLILFILLMISCDLFNETKTKEPVYDAEIAWTLNTKMYSYLPSTDMVRYDNYLYLIDGNQYYEDPFFILKKIDIESGKLIWQTEPINSIVTCNVVKCGTKLYLSGKNDNYLYCFDNETGGLSASVTFSAFDEINTKISPERNIVSYLNRYLFWSNNKNIDGKIIKLDTEKIDFTKKPDELQIVEVEFFANTGDDNDYIFSAILLEEDSVFFITKGDRENNTLNKVGSIKCQDGKLNWFYKISNSYAKGGGFNLYYVDDKLYAFIGASVCFEAKTGKVIYEFVQNFEDILKGEISISKLWQTSGVSYSNGRFYCTTEASDGTAAYLGIDKKYVKNIQCIDAKNGELIWGDLPKKSSSLDGRPIVINGKVFVTTYLQGLRVYDEKTGKLIGVDEKLITPDGKNESYKDLLIIMQWDLNNNSGILTAIRVN